MNKSTALAILFSATMIIVAMLFVGKTNNNLKDTDTLVNNVFMENGKQVILIDVQDGYNPQVSTAKAGIPSVIRFKTNSSFSCASSVILPSINYRSNLPRSGNTDIDLPAQTTGTFRGMCGMGMYNFSIEFK